MISLPNECLYITLRLLDPQDLAICCQVNHSWGEAATDDKLWKRFIPENLAKTAIKNYVNGHAVTSIEGILNRINSFCSHGSSYGMFRCYFPLNKSIIINAKLEWQNDFSNDSKHIETCVFLKRISIDKHINPPQEIDLNEADQLIDDYEKRTDLLWGKSPAHCIVIFSQLPPNKNLGLPPKISDLSCNDGLRMQIYEAFKEGLNSKKS
ncbi:MAG: F-box protein [Candidatus Protochlamydia sp.]|nr:F-box protein [Candidatus Protochlamydia sp.]